MKLRIRQVGALIRTDVISIVRYWYAHALGVLMTVFYYMVFAGNVPKEIMSNLTYTFVGLAVLASTLLRFSGRVAEERSQQWYVFLRTVPAPLWTKFVAYFAVAFVMGVVAAFGVISAGKVFYDFEFATSHLAAIPIIVLFGSAVFAPIGIALGYLLSPKVSVFAAGFVYLLSALGSGLFTSGRSPLGGSVAEHFLPLTVVQRFASAIVLERPALMLVSLGIGVMWIVVSLGSATIAYRRDESRRFGLGSSPARGRRRHLSSAFAMSRSNVARCRELIASASIALRVIRQRSNSRSSQRISARVNVIATT